MKPLLWLVEDEPSIADTLIYTLESEGFQVRWFERGEPAAGAGGRAVVRYSGGDHAVDAQAGLVSGGRSGAPGGGRYSSGSISSRICSHHCCRRSSLMSY